MLLVTPLLAADGEVYAVAQGALAMRSGMLLARLAQTVAAYPTWSLSTRVAAARFFGDVGGHRARPARSADPSS